MKSNLLMVLMLSSVAAPGALIASPPQSQSRWEYKQLRADFQRDSELLQTKMDELGANGWELTGVVARRDVSGADTLLFKRIKHSEAVQVEFDSETGVTRLRGTKEAVERAKIHLEDISKKPKGVDDVRIQVDSETGVIMIRGHKESVERTAKVIDEIKLQSPKND